MFMVASPTDRPNHKLCLTATSTTLDEETQSFPHSDLPDSLGYTNYDDIRYRDHSAPLTNTDQQHENGYGDDIYGSQSSSSLNRNGGREGRMAHHEGRGGNHQALLNRLSSNGTLLVTGHAHSCPRRHVPPTTFLSVNLTIKGESRLISISHYDL